MLVFSTKISLKNTVTDADMQKLFVKWVLNSPNYKLKFDPKKAEENFSESSESEKFSLISYKNIVACRLEAHEDNSIWHTDCVFLDEAANKYLLVQVNCNTKTPSPKLPYVHKPYIIKLIMSENICDNDGDLKITDEPKLLKDDDLDLCKKIILGQSNISLPVVYVSRNRNDGTDIDFIEISKWLSGTAHIFVEPSINFSFKLKELVGGKNAYGGFVGIYYPKSRCEFCSIRDYTDSKAMAQDIARCIRLSLTNMVNAAEYNWEHINSLLAKENFNNEKEKFKQLIYTSDTEKNELQEKLTKSYNEFEKFVSTFDSDNKKLQEKLADSYNENEALKIQLETYKNKADVGIALKIKNENEFYPGEFNDLVLIAIEKYKSCLLNATRAHILCDELLKSNNFIKRGEEIFKELEKISKGNFKDEAALKKIGFSIEGGEKGAHPKLVFMNDQRWKFTLSNTASDYRAAANTFSDIRKQLTIYNK